MTTLVVELTPLLAKGLTRAAERNGLSNADMAREAIRLLVRSVAPDVAVRSNTGRRKRREARRGR